MAHRSWCAETPGEQSNERLEFLGDAVLGWAVADLVYRRYADLPEGKLTDLRKSVVNADGARQPSPAASSSVTGCCSARASRRPAGGRKTSILSDALEAVLGAIYLDGGAVAAFDFVERMPGRSRSPTRSPGSTSSTTRRSCRSSTARIADAAPVYVVSAEGPDHAKQFSATVYVGGRAIGEGSGRSKKSAEQAAASGSRSLVASPNRRAGAGRRALARRRARAPRGRDRPPRARRARAVGRNDPERRGRSRAHRAAHVARSARSTACSACASSGRPPAASTCCCPLDSGDVLMVHLRMSGQLLIAPSGAPRPPHTHVALGLEGDEELWFVDPRTFGEMVVFDPANVEVELPEVARLGIDPLSDEFTRPAVAALLRGRRSGR